MFVFIILLCLLLFSLVNVNAPKTRMISSYVQTYLARNSFFWLYVEIADFRPLNSWSYPWLQFLAGPTSVDLIKKKKKVDLLIKWKLSPSGLGVTYQGFGSRSVHVGVCVPEIVRACSWTLWELCFWVYVSGFGFAGSWVYVWFLIIRQMLARVVVNQKCILYPLSSFFSFFFLTQEIISSCCFSHFLGRLLLIVLFLNLA